MAAVKRLLSQAHRTCFTSPPPRLHLSSLYLRTFSSESDSPAPPPPPTNPRVREPIPLQTVSYEPKPKPDEQKNSSANVISVPDEVLLKDSPPPPRREPESQPDQQQLGRSWGREEMRYMKDSPITLVSYANQVAPLPEDRVENKEEKSNEELEKERRWIDQERFAAARARVLTRGNEAQEDFNLPFPKMIKPDKTDQATKKKKVLYDLKEAIRLAKAKARNTFDETLEAHVKMSPELRRTDLKLNGFVRFPHGFGKTYRVAVFAEGAAADEARDAGADVVGGPELVEEILAGQVKIDFDKCIATPSMMQHVKKLSRNLKQLMPDPKKRTVTNDMSRAVKESKEQGVLFKKDKTAIVHLGLGKVSFSEDALRDNIGAFVSSLLVAKPAGLKKSSKFAGYVDSFHICSTMGPSFPVTIQSLSMAAERYNRSQLKI